MTAIMAPFKRKNLAQKLHSISLLSPVKFCIIFIIIICLLFFSHLIHQFILSEQVILYWPISLLKTPNKLLTFLCFFLAIIFIFHRRVLTPLRAMAVQMAGLPPAAGASETRDIHGLLDVRRLARDVAEVAALAHHYQRQHREAADALDQARRSMAGLQQQHQTMVAATQQPITQQYQSVLAYAHYLEEQIGRQRLDPGLRYDFDDVCESSFRLKLIAGALAQLNAAHSAESTPFPLAGLMQQTMLTLAPSLDRRAMKLTTAEVDESVIAVADPQIVAHAVWMMLLGIIGYAAEESTLRIRCLRNHAGDRALISIAVSELSPGSLSVAEREAHLARQLQHLTPHMFAETIRIHASVQLAQLLLTRLDATINVLPLTHYACEICLDLPAGPS